MKKHKVIIVEDDVDLANLTADFLQSFEFECQLLHSAANAVQEIIAQQPSLVLLDVMLPDGDGLDICRQITSQYHGKVVMLTARTELIDQVLGLEIGADDYITKPIEPRLLLAKCRAVLRRDQADTSVEKTLAVESDDQSTTYSFSDFEVNTVRREVRKQGTLQAFSNPEYELLVLLIERKGQIVSRDDVFQRLRGIDYDGQSRQIDIYISNIRQKLGDNSLIKTIRSKGYVFVG
ncbi:response regulator transcription factor [Endozoicomonas sp. G2_1]|uniref:response regulator transcription factor n=1 Tax=Endozoicomonas sp. G2_1 TaxID=2821091 RepID=UPI001ADBD653|nr:response regulator transcription factor [Endozoicomonas sp. G2_1]MBO9489694.1 response regulator transcription factor [Endozoicomonas sp. G2_1]